jgi:indolepyruvate ferredoxin oxidoreductase
VQPVETEFGRKRRIDQSSCNKDFSCLNGFCPSFVTVHGAKLRRATGAAGGIDPLAGVPTAPISPLGAEGWASIIDGVGGTGVVTLGAILGMAAHLEGKGCGMIDMAGLAQKGGAVFTHVRIARTPAEISTIRVSAGKADVVLGCDLVVSGARKVLGAVREGHTIFVANTAEIMPGEFTRSPDFSLPVERLKKAIRAAAGEKALFFDATRAANVLFGNAIGANMLLLGVAAQHGGLPVSTEAVERAIELNGESVAMNIAAFRWGRRAAHDPDFVRGIVAERGTRSEPVSASLDELVSRRVEFLTGYQNSSYAERYRKLVERIRQVEQSAGASSALAEAVARNLFRAMAIKDEYEVARLYTGAAFRRQLGAEFDSFDRLEFHLAPPVLGRKDTSGSPLKSSFGPWMMKAFGVLAAFKGLRGTRLDLFGYTEERRQERAFLAQYEADLDMIAVNLKADTLEAAIALASIPSLVRGYGYVKARNLAAALSERQRLLERWNTSLEMTRGSDKTRIHAAI